MTFGTVVGVLSLILAMAAFVRHPSGRTYLRVLLDTVGLTA
ncbi:MAG: hypothetical protein ACYDH5_12730 [Acidimicrobiales bacterium]